MLRLKAKPEIQINNNLVKVTKWSFPPQGETGWHLHDMDYVVVPQTTGELLLENVSVLENFKINLYCFDLQDYHCHLTSSEVVGYLAGKFDPQSHRKCIWISLFLLRKDYFV